MVTGYRYTVTCDAGEGHLVLGKITTQSPSTAFKNAVSIHDPSAQLVGSLWYDRLLLKSVVYCSTVRRSTCTDDSVVTLADGKVGVILTFISYCSEGCNCQVQGAKCKHLIITKLYNVLKRRGQFYFATLYNYSYSGLLF